MWGLLHLRTLAGGHSKLSILANWLRLLVTYRRSARVIVEPVSQPNEDIMLARSETATFGLAVKGIAHEQTRHESAHS